MNRVLKSVLLLLVILAMEGAGAVLAENKGARNYIALRGGPGWVEDTERVVTSHRSQNMKFRSEFDINLAYGYYFSEWFRFEGQLGYVHMKLDKLASNRTGSEYDVSGKDRHYKAMLNAHAEWKTTTALTPFVGGGIGVVLVHLDHSSILLVEQNALKALQVADRGYVMETGEIVMADSAHGLF